MMIDHTCMIKENNRHAFAGRFGLSDFSGNAELVCFHTLVVDLIRGSKWCTQVSSPVITIF